MIKIFNTNDRDFSTIGNIAINPLKCREYKKKSLNGWYIEVEIPIQYKQYIVKDKLCVVKTKSKLRPQAFRIGEDIKYTSKKISFKAVHVMFDSQDYFLLDVRPTKLNGNNALNYINDRTDNISPFKVHSNIENIDTAYFIRKSLLEAWIVMEERWNGIFDADNWDISFLNKVGNDNGESIIYGKNLEHIEVYEDWTNVATKICPVGYDGLLLPEIYLESDIQYEKPYTRRIEFQTELDEEEKTEEKLLIELRKNAEKYLEENKYPKINYTISSNINQKLEIGDKVHIMHPLANILTEVLEYEYDILLKKVRLITFGNFTRDVKLKFDNIKSSVNKLKENFSKQEIAIKEQTSLINTLNKTGFLYIDENELLILDKIPKSQAKNIWRFGLGGIGFSSNGYEGPFETAITMNGQINADFITAGTMSADRIEGLNKQLLLIVKDIETVENTANNTSDKLNNLQIGGKNLQLGTEKWDNTAWLTKSNVIIEDGIATVPLNDYPRCYPINVINGEELTISIDIKSDVEHTENQYSPILFDWYNESSERVSYNWWENMCLTTEWQRYSTQITVPNNVLIKKLSIGLRSSEGRINYFRKLKVERGNKETDWTPAPEDIRTETNTQIKLNSDEILNSVEHKTSQLTQSINNKYQEIIQKFDNVPNNDDLVTIEERVETIQKSNKYAIDIVEEIQVNGISKVKTETGYTFDNKGLSIEKTDAKTKSLLNEKGLAVKDNTGSSEENLLFAGYDEQMGETIVKSKNMTVEKYLTIGTHSRIEDYEEGTAVFYLD